MIINDKNELFQILNNEFPINNIEKWDFSGLSPIDNFKNNINNPKILITLDITKDVLLYAKKKKVNIIISHHPFVFEENIENYQEKYSFFKDTFKKSLFENVTLFSVHTNFDNHENGTISSLLNFLNLKKYGSIEKMKYSAFIKLNQSLDIKKISSLFKKTFSFESLLTNNKNKKNIESLFISPGAGDVNEVIEYNANNKVDLFISSDIKWNEKNFLIDNNIDFLEVPHKIEEVFIKSIHDFLKIMNIENEILVFKSKIKNEAI